MKTWLITSDMVPTNPRIYHPAKHVVISYIVEQNHAPSEREVLTHLSDVAPIFEPVVSIVADITHDVNSL